MINLAFLMSRCLTALLNRVESRAAGVPRPWNNTEFKRDLLHVAEEIDRYANTL